MFRQLPICILSVIWIFSTPTFARNFVLTIGGGYSPDGNQVSLEKNVLLFQRVLSTLPPCERHDIYFADGDDESKDLQVIDPTQVPKANRLMAEFFGSTRELGLRYRNHQVPNVSSASKPENIRGWFNQVGTKILPGDNLFIYVTAHGQRSRDRDKEYNTSIAMWNNSALQMTEFAKLLDRLDPNVNVFMVMVQCYTGGFSHVMFREGDPSKGLSPQRRVGFFATVHDRPAAGCTPEVDEANYVEYSTYFWAAVSGTDRTGQSIEKPDYDGDGQVSMEEAHAYTVLHADTIDVPVKTSGEFLSIESRFGDGQGDLLKNDEPFSVVLKLASPVQRLLLNQLSKKLELTGENRLVDAWQKTRVDRRRRRRPSSEASSIRSRIANDLKKDWPELSNTMNPLCIELVTSRHQEFVAAIEDHPSYDDYKNELAKQEAVPDDQQMRAQYERFLRVADNVILAENLRRMNQPKRLAEFEAILQAEQRPFLQP